MQGTSTSGDELQHHATATSIPFTLASVADAARLTREQRRIAADVHDLIMQDLALALASARALTDALVDVGHPEYAARAGAIAAASERALTGARSLLDELRNRGRMPVVPALERGVRAATRDAGRATLSFDASRVPAASQPDQPTCDALVHIGREAVTNAIKHAHPSSIEVVLEHADEWRLRVSDDGCGFEVGAWGIGANGAAGGGANGDSGSGANGAAGNSGVGGIGGGVNGAARSDVGAVGGDGANACVSSGFGLQSMRRCASELGGSLRVCSASGSGTIVEATLP